MDDIAEKKHKPVAKPELKRTFTQIAEPEDFYHDESTEELSDQELDGEIDEIPEEWRTTKDTEWVAISDIADILKRLRAISLKLDVMPTDLSQLIRDVSELVESHTEATSTPGPEALRAKK